MERSGLVQMVVADLGAAMRAREEREERERRLGIEAAARASRRGRGTAAPWRRAMRLLRNGWAAVADGAGVAAARTECGP